MRSRTNILRAPAWRRAAATDLIPRLLAVGTVLSLLLLVVYPLAMVFIEAIYPRFPLLAGGATVRLFQTALGATFLRQGLLSSVELGLGAAIVSVVLASPMAFLVERTDLPQRKLLDFLLLLPFTTPPFLSAEVWILILERRGYLQQLTGLDASGAQGLLFSYNGIVLVLALHLFPLVYFAQRAGLALIPSSVIDAARACGAGPFKTAFRIMLPLMLPSTLAGALLVFAAGMSEYGAPATLAIQAHFFATSVNIGNLTSQYPTNRPLAAALSVILMISTFAAVMIARGVVGRGRYTGRSLTSIPLALGRWRWAGLVLSGSIALVSGVIPWTAVAVTSVLRTLSGGLVWSNISPQRLFALLSQPQALDALRTSVELAAVAATAVAMLGATLGYLITRPGLRGRWLLDGIATLPLATPGIVIAVAVIVVWNQPFMPGAIYESQWVLAIAYTVVFLPFGVRYATSALQALPPGLDEAGRMSGAGPLRRIVKLILPLMAPAIISAWALSFAIGMRELESSLIVRPPGTTTLSVFMWQAFTQGNPLSGMGMAVLTLAVTCIALVTVRTLAGRLAPFA